MSLFYVCVVILFNYLIVFLDEWSPYFSTPNSSIEEPAVSIFAPFKEPCRLHFLTDFLLCVEKLIRH